MTTPVIFRKWPASEGGEVIALFPTELGDTSPFTSSSYQTTGQHGSADPVGVIQRTKRATPAEYAPLLRELEGIGYDDLKVVQRLQGSYLGIRRQALADLDIPSRAAPKAQVRRKHARRGVVKPSPSLRAIRK